jgi:hypothetical protein
MRAILLSLLIVLQLNKVLVDSAVQSEQRKVNEMRF